jgi:xanthine dehydrogenase iron-sulfur cluster and FAD-binding subunit A
MCRCAGVHTIWRAGRTRSFVGNVDKAGYKTQRKSVSVQNVTTNPHFN